MIRFFKITFYYFIRDFLHLFFLVINFFSYFIQNSTHFCKERENLHFSWISSSFLPKTHLQLMLSIYMEMMHALTSDISALTTYFTSRNLSLLLPSSVITSKKTLTLVETITSDELFLFNMSVALIFTWIVIVGFSTFWPIQFFEILSIKSSLSELVSFRNSRLDVLDVFRVIAIVWVMANHLGSEGRIDILERKPSAEAFKVKKENVLLLLKYFYFF